MSAIISVKPIPYYMILSKCSGKALDAVEHNVRLFFAFNTPVQHWSFENRGNGYFSIINRSTHQVLDVDMAGVENGSPIHTWSDINADNQLWVLEPVGTDTYRIRAKSSNRYLDIVDGSLNAEAGLHIWSSTTSDTQLWLIKEVIDEPKNEPSAEIHKRTGRKKISDADKKAAESFGVTLDDVPESIATTKNPIRKTRGKAKNPKKVPAKNSKTVDKVTTEITETPSDTDSNVDK